MAASAVDSDRNTSLDYIRMEDAFRGHYPIAGPTVGSESSVRAADREARDIVAPLPCASPPASPPARSETSPQGILRCGSASGGNSKNCRKKQVSIKLPERARRRYEPRGTDGDSSSDDGTHQEETMVEVEVDEEEEEEEKERTAGELSTRS